MLFSGAVPLIENRDLGNGNFLALFDAPEIAARTRPAQFVMLRVRDGSDPLLGRPFSVARTSPPGAARRSTVELIYKAIGRGTAILAELKSGALLHMVGPLGNPFPDPPAADTPVLFVAGGIGIAPFPILAEHLCRGGVTPKLLYGARTAADLIGRDLFPTGVRFALATDDGSAGHAGFVTELLEQELAALPEHDRTRALAYVCGPTPMMAAADAVLERHGAGGHFSVESFMACGFGVCLSCVVPMRAAGDDGPDYRRICVDGPTFPAGSIDWAGSARP